MSVNCTQDNANTTECVAQAQRASDIAFASSLVVNFALLIIFFLGFLLFKHVKKFSVAYWLRQDVPESRRGPFGWFISALLNVTEKDIEDKRGLDTLVYLVVLRHLFWCCVGYCFYGFIILVPVHATAGGNLTGIASIGVGNVPDGSPALAADIVGVFFNSVVACAFLYNMYRTCTHLRVRFKARLDRPENFALLVRELPPTWEAPQVREMFEKVFPGSVAHVQMAYNTPGLWKHLELRQKMGLKLEEMRAFLLKKGERKQVRHLPPFYLCGTKKDGIEFFQTRLDEESAIVHSKIERAPVEAKYRANVAFVTFSSPCEAKKAAQTVLVEHRPFHTLQKSIVVEPAPAPPTVKWRALHVSHLNRFIRCCIVNVATFLLIFFWMIPVAFASSLANLTTLSTVLPFIVPILSVSAAVKGFVEGFLPGLVLIIFFAILVNFIIRPLARAEGQPSQAIEERSVFNKYFLFLVINIFLGSVFASGFFNVISQVIQNPASIPQLLAYALPKQVTYFLSYVMILSLSGFGMLLWTPGRPIVHLILGLLAKTRRAARNTINPVDFAPAPSYARHCLVFLLVTVYSTLNPLIIPFGMIYFGLAYVVERFNIVYVYTSVTPAEGTILPAVFARLVWGVLIFQISVAAILGLASFPPAAVIFAFFVLTIMFAVYTDRQLHHTFKHGACLNTMNNDVVSTPMLNEPAEELPHLVPCANTYKYPSLREPLFVDAELQEPLDAPVYEVPLWWTYTWESVLSSSLRHSLGIKEQFDDFGVRLE